MTIERLVRTTRRLALAFAILTGLALAGAIAMLLSGATAQARDLILATVLLAAGAGIMFANHATTASLARSDACSEAVARSAALPDPWESDDEVDEFIRETYAAHDASASGTGLTLAQYASGARTTARYPEQDLLGLYYAALGLAGEAGEVANKIKKLMRDRGETLPDDARAAIADELGDVLWYAAMLAHELKVPLEDVATSNLATLRDRAARGAIGGSGDQR
jgi:NTP pyrophosphatase (non-canonical NTP hydrolase)